MLALKFFPAILVPQKPRAARGITEHRAQEAIVTGRRQRYLQVRDAQTGQRVLLHRQLASSFLGRPLLPKEIVHHRDGNPRNNTRENLLVLPSQRYHAHIEHLLRCARRGQALLFPEYLDAVQQRQDGTLFENVLAFSEPRSRPYSSFW